jgi:hypothetical protein
MSILKMKFIEMDKAPSVNRNDAGGLEDPADRKPQKGLRFPIDLYAYFS